MFKSISTLFFFLKSPESGGEEYKIGRGFPASRRKSP